MLVQNCMCAVQNKPTCLPSSDEGIRHQHFCRSDSCCPDNCTASQLPITWGSESCNRMLGIRPTTIIRLRNQQSCCRSWSTGGSPAFSQTVPPCTHLPTLICNLLGRGKEGNYQNLGYLICLVMTISPNVNATTDCVCSQQQVLTHCWRALRCNRHPWIRTP